MPICPGCERPVPYDRLATHEQYCAELGADTSHVRKIERLDRRISDAERRMYRRLRALEAELDITRSRTDEKGGTNGRSQPQR
ncbi:hypothetical protein SAMN05216388_101926 [Halorientalis persicus]|jgi:hypothetical protein|uniref:Uncharacterized protein n=1 Tax=Halorientalis persicus TaxID=1367881 RepID=A0A1H8SH80_9EURY|nr:hypothetical protein [Halorientalis persicus]SEO77897.1 hypothetical protein SAMN05216388_101926 [Halorientalis persicus]